MQRLLAEVRRLSPRARVVGAIVPPFRAHTPEEEEETVRAIDATGADVVWVGLGCPKQELWISRMRPRLDAPVLVGVGAAFDFLAGTKPQAPRWLQGLGLEWSFRLLTEPRRLWRRYLVSNTVFLAHVASTVSVRACQRLRSIRAWA